MGPVERPFLVAVTLLMAGCTGHRFARPAPTGVPNHIEGYLDPFPMGHGRADADLHAGPTPLGGTRRRGPATTPGRNPFPPRPPAWGTLAARRLHVHPSRGPHTSLLYCFRDVSRWRVAWNWLWIALAKKAPWYAMRRSCLRRTGMKVGRHVAVGLDAQFDALFPHLITLEDDALIGYGTTILCHEYLRSEYRTGPVRVGKDASVGAQCLILAGVTVAPGTVVSAMSLVNSDVSGFVGGVPARPLTKRPPAA